MTTLVQDQQRLLEKLKKLQALQLAKTQADTRLSAQKIWERWYCDADCDGQPHQGKPHKHSRPAQRPPKDKWRIWYLRGGRGSGKTRAGAEWLAAQALADPGEYAVVAPTFGDARGTCVEGPSGLNAVLGDQVTQWNRSLGELYLKGGSIIRCDGADDGALRVQGKNLRAAWADEIGLWRNWQTAWKESLRLAVRISPARIVATGTPKSGSGLVRLLNETAHVSAMRMIDNVANLDEALVEELVAEYEGTSLGLQELDGELITEAEGALVKLSQIADGRVSEAPEELEEIVISVDPAGGETGDEVGIVVVGKAGEHAYVLADLTRRMGAQQWTSRAVAAYHEFEADRILAERNYGGDMVVAVIKAIDDEVPVKTVVASRGKRVRAEPVAAKYAQGFVHHVGVHPVLEGQWTMWEPDSPYSPGALDACVWAVTHLLLQRRTKMRFHA